MNAPISKGYRVRIKATGQTGVIARQRPDDQPFGSPPQRPVRPPRRFYVVDFDNKIELGWHGVGDLEPYTRQPGDIPEHIEAAGRRGARLLLAHREAAISS